MAFDRPKELLKPIKPRWIVLSFVLAIAVELLPLDATLANWLPDFTAMLALYWTLNQPRRFGIGWSFGIGLIADVASASVFGQHALAYSVISYLLLSRQHHAVAIHNQPTVGDDRRQGDAVILGQGGKVFVLIHLQPGKAGGQGDKTQQHGGKGQQQAQLKLVFRLLL